MDFEGTGWPMLPRERGLGAAGDWFSSRTGQGADIDKREKARLQVTLGEHLLSMRAHLPASSVALVREALQEPGGQVISNSRDVLPLRSSILRYFSHPLVPAIGLILQTFSCKSNPVVTPVGAGDKLQLQSPAEEPGGKMQSPADDPGKNPVVSDFWKPIKGFDSYARMENSFLSRNPVSSTSCYVPMEDAFLPRSCAFKLRDGIKKCPPELQYITVDSILGLRGEKSKQPLRDVPLAGLFSPIGDAGWCEGGGDPRMKCIAPSVLQQSLNSDCFSVIVWMTDQNILHSVFEKTGTGGKCKLNFSPTRVVFLGVLKHFDEYARLLPYDICLLDDPEPKKSMP